MEGERGARGIGGVLEEGSRRWNEEKGCGRRKLDYSQV